MRKIYFLSLLIITVLTSSAQFTTPNKTKDAKIGASELGTLLAPPSLFAPGCDTLLYSSTFATTYGVALYRVEAAAPYDSGYLTGTNFYGDKQKGNFYNVTNSTNKNFVTAVRFALGKANSTNLTHTFKFNVYNVDTNGVGSITLAGSSPNIPLSGVQGVVGGFADYTFPTAIPLTTGFFIVSADFSTLSLAAGDTFGIYSNIIGRNPPDIGVEQWSDDSWVGISDGWGISSGMMVYLFPYVSDNSTCTLPVSMAGLTATQAGDANKLKWVTKTEIGNKGFEIERSSDGNFFTHLDFVPSLAPLGNSTHSIEYEYVDQTPNAGSSYYRIKQIDQNGKMAFSNIALLNRSLDKLKGIITYYPNPVKSMLNLQLAGTEPGNSLITVTNMNGMTVMQQSIKLTGSLQNIGINVSSLPKGTYIVRLNGEAKSAKFVKE